jgi:hypothetical protein
MGENTMNAITALPTIDHDGESTLEAIYRVATTLRAAGVTFHMTPGCYGFWYEGDDLYENEAVLVEMDGDEAAIKRALARFGEDAEQLEVLLVERREGFTLGSGWGKADAAALAKEHGGSTLMPNGVAVSFKYRALVHGRDYVSTVTGAKR